ncbi:MAG: thioredoxin fold domain-containing protein [Bacteroidia bacterium]
MKKVSYLILFFAGTFLFACYSDIGSDSRKEGIIFFTGTWNEALKKSSNENKPIFLDLSASWCGYCKKLKRKTFSDSTAAAYFNAKFINIELDGEEGTGLVFAEKFGVVGYPSLFIIDKSENIILRTSGYMNVEQLIDFGETALKKVH